MKKLLLLSFVITLAACGSTSGGGSTADYLNESQALTIASEDALGSGIYYAITSGATPSEDISAKGISLKAAGDACSGNPETWELGCTVTTPYDVTYGTGDSANIAGNILATLTTLDPDPPSSYPLTTTFTASSGEFQITLTNYPFSQVVDSTTYTGTLTTSTPLACSLTSGAWAVIMDEGSCADNDTTYSFSCTGTLSATISTDDEDLSATVSLGDGITFTISDFTFSSYCLATAFSSGTATFDVELTIDSGNYSCSGEADMEGDLEIDCSNY